MTIGRPMSQRVATLKGDKFKSDPGSKEFKSDPGITELREFKSDPGSKELSSSLIQGVIRDTQKSH